MIKNLFKVLIPSLVVIAALLVANLFYCSGNTRIPGALSKEKAVEKTLAFLNDVALQGQATASILDTTEESGLYKIKLKIGEQEYESYVTKDAKLLFAYGTEITNSDEQETADIPKSDIPKVELFVMSFCPYGNQAEEAMEPVVGLLKNKADIEVHYVIYEHYQNNSSDYCLDKDGKYCSMHGISELRQDIREFCIQKYYQDKVWSFMKEINSKCSVSDVDTCWVGVAKSAGIDTEKIKTCQKNEGLTIVAEELALDQQYDIAGSPQLMINGKSFEGSRTPEAFKNAICSAFNSQPEECSQTLSNEGDSVSGGCE